MEQNIKSGKGKTLEYEKDYQFHFYKRNQEKLMTNSHTYREIFRKIDFDYLNINKFDKF